MIAVITPVYNGAETIKKSISSLLAQTVNNWVSIIVNDGSTDATADVLQAYNDDNRFVVINLPKNVGRGAARNVGLQRAKAMGATYMCMLDADDEYRVDKLEKQFAFMEANLHIALLSSGIGLINNTGMYRVLACPVPNRELKAENYLQMIAVPHASSIIRLKDVSVEFNVEMRYSEDQDFMRRLLINKTYLFNDDILYYYYRDESFSSQKYKKSLTATYLSFKNLNVKPLQLFKLKMISEGKLFFYKVLEVLKMEHVYFNRIGRQPTAREVNDFVANEKRLKRKNT